MFESEGEEEEGEGREGGREVEWALARYAHRCLDALGIKNGLSHAEIMWLEGEGEKGGEGGVGGEPCLVEVGARPHGGEGTFVSLTEAAIGYNQLSVALDLIEDSQALALCPVLPPRLKSHAAEVCLVSRQAGRLLGHYLKEKVNADALPSLKVCSRVSPPSLPSFLVTLSPVLCFYILTPPSLPPSPPPSLQSVALHVNIGDCLKKTVDMLSSPGSAILCHPNPKVLEEDYEKIHAMDNLFMVEEEGEEGREEGGEDGTTTTEEGESSSGESSRGEGEEVEDGEVEEDVQKEGER